RIHTLPRSWLIRSRPLHRRSEPNVRRPMTHTPSTSVLELLPAVDVAGGQAVQLVQGKADSGGRYGDPFTAAKTWQDAGAEWIHLVDLDAAFGRGHNRELLRD